MERCGENTNRYDLEPNGFNKYYCIFLLCIKTPGQYVAIHSTCCPGVLLYMVPIKYMFT